MEEEFRDEGVASIAYFLETGYDFWDLSYPEQKRRIEVAHERINS